MAYVLLFIAIALEIVGALALKTSAGMTRLAPTVVMFATFSSSLAIMSFVTTKLPLSLTYPTFAAFGTAGAVLGAVLWLGERITLQQWIGIAVIIAGIIVIHGPPLFSETD